MTDILNIAARRASIAPAPIAPFVTTIPGRYLDTPMDATVVTFPSDADDAVSLHRARVESLYSGKRIHTFVRPDGVTIVAAIDDAGMFSRCPMYRMSKREVTAINIMRDAEIMDRAKRQVWAGIFSLDTLNLVIRKSVEREGVTTNDAGTITVEKTGGKGRPRKVYDYITPDTTDATLGRKMTNGERSYRARLRKASGWTPATDAEVTDAESPAHRWARISAPHKTRGIGAR